MELQLTSNDKTVKSILSANFHISVMETPKGRYYVEYGHMTDEIKRTSQVRDMNLVNDLFEMLIIDLQGH